MILRRWVIVAALSIAARAIADPQNDYILNCRGCHRPDGSGMPGGAPDFRGALGKLASIEGGRAYLVRVPGVAQSDLSDERTAVLLNWLIRQFDPQTVAVADFTREEVAAARHTPLVDVSGTRVTLLERIAHPVPQNDDRSE